MIGMLEYSFSSDKKPIDPLVQTSDSTKQYTIHKILEILLELGIVGSGERIRIAMPSSNIENAFSELSFRYLWGKAPSLG